MKDFVAFVTGRNRVVHAAHADFFAGLPETLGIAELRARAEAAGAPDLVRLTYAYLPLSFSRRHGDPSRYVEPLRHQGQESGWHPAPGLRGQLARYIFQNWEALAWSYPR